MWLEEAGLYHYKARAYHPALGRFMQADPIGYGDGMNMYAYVGNDPVNARDPSGMVEDEIIVKSGTRLPKEPSSPIYVGAGALAHFSGGGFNRGMFGGGGAFYPQAGRNTLPPKDSDDVDRVYSYGVLRSWGRIPTLVAGFSALNFLKLHVSASGQGNSGSGGDGEEEVDCESGQPDENWRQTAQYTAAGIGALCGPLLAPLCAAPGAILGDDVADAAYRAGCREGQRRRELESRGCVRESYQITGMEGELITGGVRCVCPDGSVHPG